MHRIYSLNLTEAVSLNVTIGLLVYHKRWEGSRRGGRLQQCGFI